MKKFEVGDIVGFKEDAGDYGFGGDAYKTYGKVVRYDSNYCEIKIYNNDRFTHHTYAYVFAGKEMSDVFKLKKNTTKYNIAVEVINSYEQKTEKETVKKSSQRIHQKISFKKIAPKIVSMVKGNK